MPGDFLPVKPPLCQEWGFAPPHLQGSLSLLDALRTRPYALHNKVICESVSVAQRLRPLSLGVRAASLR